MLLFKLQGGTTLPADKLAFNTMLSKPCVKSEHCIGMLKGQFPMLHGIHLRLSLQENMNWIIDYVSGAITLHNFLLDDILNEEWSIM